MCSLWPGTYKKKTLSLKCETPLPSLSIAANSANHPLSNNPMTLATKTRKSLGAALNSSRMSQGIDLKVKKKKKKRQRKEIGKEQQPDGEERQAGREGESHLLGSIPSPLFTAPL